MAGSDAAPICMKVSISGMLSESPGAGSAITGKTESNRPMENAVRQTLIDMLSLLERYSG
jgi:hypothetical protein